MNMWPMDSEFVYVNVGHLKVKKEHQRVKTSGKCWNCCYYYLLLLIIY